MQQNEKFVAETTTSKISGSSDGGEHGTVLNITAPTKQTYTLKMDLRLIPILGCTYTILFLDRTNIANARIEGMEKSLKMPSNGYNTALWIFYIPFVLIEIPSNMIMSMPRVRPNIFLGCNMLILGIVSTCQGLTKSYGGILACRFLMGIFEATLPAGAALLVAEYYTRKQASLRFAMFFTFGVLGPCISGLLAYGIRNMHGIQGKEGWRWIFILEGIFTICVSFLVFILVPDFPERTKILTASEKEHLLATLRADKGDQEINVKGTNWLKTGWRFPFILLGILCVLVGWIINIVYSEGHGVTAAVRYFSLFCMSAGTFIQMSLTTSWLVNNLRGRASVAVGTAIILGIGNCANFVASNVFIKKEAPRYPTAFRTGLGLTVAGAVFCLAYVGILWQHNQKLAKKRSETGAVDDQKEYRYQY
ncbi:MFS general substrate transporter [Ophiobolus disseminans]|uniref:MFS general substrate transporter n=1 Tax=Ophiobolus disseminans TaxID=1469910 RepID=A0A6A6ZC43_9PLEO|nr:MFS general substrate transporter [Ophiobolus disseminans]